LKCEVGFFSFRNSAISFPGTRGQFSGIATPEGEEEGRNKHQKIESGK
jgi:hypothetical protein